MTVRHFGDATAPTVVIADVAAINGIGVDAATTWSFWRAEANGQRESPFRCASGARATMVLVRTYPPRLTGVARLLRLMNDGLAQLAGSLDALGAEARVGVLLCLAERFHDPVDRGIRAQRGELEGALARWCAGRGRASVLGVVARGHASLAEALVRAGEALEGGALDAAVTVCVDGYHDADVVEGLITSERLFDGKNLDAMIPGEGCAALLLTRPLDARRAGLAARAVVESAAHDEERGGMFSEVHCTGEGLARAAGAVAERAAQMRQPIGWILGDLTSESYRGREHALALPRAFAPGGLDDGGASFAPRVTDRVRTDWLPERFGDLGAATMGTAAVIASEAFQRGDPRPRRCVILGSSVVSARGAVMLAAG